MVEECTGNRILVFLISSITISTNYNPSMFIHLLICGSEEHYRSKLKFVFVNHPCPLGREGITPKMKDDIVII